MSVGSQPSHVRALVLKTLQHLGATVFSEFQVDETIIVQQGRCMARSYRADAFFAMWLVELGLVQFYDADGDVLLVINLLDDAPPAKLAA